MVEIVRPPVVGSVNVAPFRIVSVPEPASLTPVFGLVLFRLIETLDPLVVLVAAQLAACDHHPAQSSSN